MCFTLLPTQRAFLPVPVLLPCHGVPLLVTPETPGIPPLFRVNRLHLYNYPLLIWFLSSYAWNSEEELACSVAGPEPDVITSGSATLHISSSLKWRTKLEIRSAALGDGIVSNKPCMTQSFHFKWGMKLLHPLTACSMKEIYLHLIALDPRRLHSVISRR